ncbi:hypothetical protein [Thermocrinis minervae]|uniref:Uncharacterized protein n=1 Tax=Thermocrinis minervae TaxID=381751 RepID=A0A1M6QS21_9AQUI|nr:hypothetical protein [Thermocrinis minervae]SHK23014.1 hypothetical protein SAMN05444391_0367 [Thermocrinis minervae]
MSVRHLVRQRVEDLFNRLGLEEALPVYALYIKDEDPDTIEVSEFELESLEPEDKKKLLDRITRESLEKEVLGYKLAALITHEGKVSTDMDLSQEILEEAIRRIQTLREE